jgi:hypothetical protein
MGKSQSLWKKISSMETCSEYYFLGASDRSSLKDAPRNKEFSHPSTAHAWLGRMQSSGFLDQFLEELLKLAEQLGCIDAQRLSVDGFFSSGRGGGELVDYGYKPEFWVFI